jgi:acyl-CoA synthetase (AMP-forming)/AMP-acid ligase II
MDPGRGGGGPPELGAGGRTMGAVLDDRARTTPDAVAFTFVGDDGTRDDITYEALRRRARLVAERLRARARDEAIRAVLLYAPGLEYIVALFGCFYAAVTAVPAYPPRRTRGLERLQTIFDDAGAQLALTTDDLLARMRSRADEWPGLRTVTWVATDGPGRGEPTGGSAGPGDPDRPALIQYTSGSTSDPKGVVVSHGNLLHNCGVIQRMFGATAASRGVIWLPPYHDMGLIGGILAAVSSGCPVTLTSPFAFLQRPLGWLELISREGATISGGPNFAYELCLAKARTRSLAHLDLRSWSVAFNGSEPVRHATLRRFAQAFAVCGFRPEAFSPCYGLAEATLMVTGHETPSAVTTFSADAASLGRHRVRPARPGEGSAVDLVASGRPAAGCRVVIVDPSTLAPCGPDEVGEIWVSGKSVAQGYWRRPDQTLATFGAFLAGGTGGPFLRTGDLGFVREGELFVTGRLKDLIIVRGRNYYPQDIELTAERSHPALRPGCNAAFAVDHRGHETLALVQEVEFRHRPEVSEVGPLIRTAIAGQHALALHRLVLVPPGTLPKTSSGKVQRQACKRDLLEGRLSVLGEWRQD